MTNGQQLAVFITASLNSFDLDITQKAQMQNVIGGNFEPEDLELAIIDVQLMVADEDVAGLIRLLKQLPKPADNNKITFFIDDVECSISDYCDMDRYKTDAKRHVKYAQMDNTNYCDMNLKEYAETPYGARCFNRGRITQA